MTSNVGGVLRSAVRVALQCLDVLPQLAMAKHIGAMHLELCCLGVAPAKCLVLQSSDVSRLEMRLRRRRRAHMHAAHMSCGRSGYQSPIRTEGTENNGNEPRRGGQSTPTTPDIFLVEYLNLVCTPLRRSSSASFAAPWLATTTCAAR